MTESLKTYINTAIETTNNELVNINNQEIVLNTNDKPDTKTQLKLNISKLYDEVEKYASKVKPYQELLSTLNSKENVEKDKSYRLLGVGLSGLVEKDSLPKEYNIFNVDDVMKKEIIIDEMIHEFQNKYGKMALYRKKEKQG